jgi:hypothetical protein
VRSKSHQAYGSYTRYCNRLGIVPMTIEWWNLLQQTPYRSRH